MVYIRIANRVAKTRETNTCFTIKMLEKEQAKRDEALTSLFDRICFQVVIRGEEHQKPHIG
jgi:hypothetical protein